MRQPISTEQLAAVVRAVQRHPQGAGVDEILRTLPSALPRRTLQRWLAVLIRFTVNLVSGRPGGRKSPRA